MQAEPTIDDPCLKDHDRYQQLSYISRGAFGFVTLALDKVTGKHVALKFIARGNKVTKYVSREVENQLRLQHPHIIELKEVFLTDEYLVLVMEHADAGELLAHVIKHKHLPEDEARWLFQQVLFAVDYCHRMGVANRDIKLENTLLLSTATSSRPLVKLADFGFSKDENHQSAPGSRVGTPAYLAPEVITTVAGRTYDAKKADVWSCGVLLYAMVTGRYPFQRATDHGSPQQQLHTVLQRILQGDYKYPVGLNLSEQFKDLIARILVAEPTMRPTVQEIIRHPWTCRGLDPSVLDFNDPLVAKSQASQPSQEMVESVRSIVAEARTLPSGHQRLQTEQQQQEQQQQEQQQQEQQRQQQQRQRQHLDDQMEAGGDSSFGNDDLGNFDENDFEYHSV